MFDLCLYLLLFFDSISPITSLQARWRSSSMRMSADVTVFGGSGFTGSRVCKVLIEKGASVTSISRSGRIPKWCKDEEWTKKVQWKSVDLLSTNEAALDQAVKSPISVVSCVGAIGTNSDFLLKGNGDANIAAFSSAKRGGRLQRAVYISVGSEVNACKDNWLPDFFNAYFEGKEIAEKAAVDAVGDVKNVCLIKPTFIYGGEDFGLLPPRVSFDYGSGVEELLSLPLFKYLADASPGLIKVALRPPVCVDSVALACAKAALDDSGLDLPILDGTEEINVYSGQPKSTGLTDAFEWSQVQMTEFYDWAKVQIPKTIDTILTKLDETKSQK